MARPISDFSKIGRSSSTEPPTAGPFPPPFAGFAGFAAGCGAGVGVGFAGFGAGFAASTVSPRIVWSMVAVSAGRIFCPSKTAR